MNEFLCARAGLAEIKPLASPHLKELELRVQCRTPAYFNLLQINGTCRAAHNISPS